MLEPDDLRSLIEVMDSGGFNRAAERLGISKSILSRRIARMELDLGARLLNRTTRGISPTEAGLELRARAEQILSALEEARDAVAQHGNGLVGRLRLTAPLSFGIRHVAPVLALMAERHPRLELDVSFSDRVVDLIGERFDAAIRIGALRDSSLVARRVGPARAVLVASPAYIARHGRPQTPADLTRHECLIYTAATEPDWKFRVGKRWVLVRPAGRLRSDSGDALIEWAKAGLGIAQVPTFLIADAIDAGTLVPVLHDYPAPEHGIYVVRPPGAYVSGKVRALIDTLIQHFGGEPVWDRCLMAEQTRRSL